MVGNARYERAASLESASLRETTSTPNFSVPRTASRGLDTAPSFMFSPDIPTDRQPDTKFTYSNEYSNNIPSGHGHGNGNGDLKMSHRNTDLSSDFAGSSQRTTYYTQRSAFTNFLRDWWLELLAFFFLVGALIAIVVAAHEYQDHPLPELPQGLTLNSIFSIFVVVLKAAMLLILAQGLSHLKWTWFKQTRPLNDLATYDWASRGPLGSVWLLFRLKGRDLLATLGALLIIAHVVLDPMAQQVIRYYNCNQVRTDVNATIPRTNAYMEIGRHVGAGTGTISNELQSAVNGGVFNPGHEVDFDCSSGNCTFPSTAYTVGMRSVCRDASDELQFQNITTADGSVFLNATLPSGLYTCFNQNQKDVLLMNMGFNITSNSVEIIRGPQTVDTLTPQDYCSGSAYDNMTDKDSNWICRGWGAARCSVEPVVYRLSSATIQSGKLYETLEYATILDSVHAAFAGNSYGVADVSCLSTDEISTLKGQGYDISDSLQWLAYNMTVDTDGNFSGSYPDIGNATSVVPKECIYQVYSTTINSLYVFFTTYFDATITPQYTPDLSVARQFYNDGGITFQSVDSLFQNISSGMTTYIRQRGSETNNNSAPAVGQVWETQTCVRIRWAYVAFPAVLTALTIFFFIAMIMVTSKSQQGLHHDFKSSPLALLFHGLDEDTIRRIETMNKGVDSNEVENLTAEAKEMMVKLQPTSRGWRFVIDENEKTLVN